MKSAVLDAVTQASNALLVPTGMGCLIIPHGTLSLLNDLSGTAYSLMDRERAETENMNSARDTRLDYK